jgi:hypothetical protein
MAQALNQAMNQTIEARSGQAMDEFLHAMAQRRRVSSRTDAPQP